MILPYKNPDAATSKKKKKKYYNNEFTTEYYGLVYKYTNFTRVINFNPRTLAAEYIKPYRFFFFFIVNELNFIIKQL